MPDLTGGVGTPYGNEKEAYLLRTLVMGLTSGKIQPPWEWILFVSAKFRADVTPDCPWDQPVLPAGSSPTMFALPLLLGS